MSDVWTWFADGGRTMFVLAALAGVLSFLILERFLALGARKRALRRGAAAEAPVTPELAGLRRMGLIRACIVIAPLLGLLGTVTGMIETFHSILHGGYITEMSDGIRKALRTTQYGLAIAAPGLLAERVLRRRSERLRRPSREPRAPQEEDA